MRYLFTLSMFLISVQAFALTLIIDNTTGSTLSYLGGSAAVPPNGSLTVSLTQIFPISRDSQLISDCKSGNAYVTDSINSYFGDDCLTYLNEIASSLGGQVIGYIGATVPSFAIVVGAKDVNGNTQAAQFNSRNSLLVSTNTSYSSGIPTQTSVSCATITTLLLGANSAAQFISIRNPTTSAATIWINIAGASATTAAPSIDISPGGEADYFASENSFLPTSQINCISAGASSQNVAVVYK